MSYLGVHLRIQYRISHKLERANALSSEDAVSMEQADFNLQERGWVDSLLNVNGLLGTIKKRGQHYYLTPA
jgi:hypothetical protein